MANWNIETCRVNEIDIHYLRTGGCKPSVVLLHGLMTSGACWTPLACALEEHYDVIMPDARGHGDSSAPEQGYRYDDLANDVMSLISKLGLAHPVLLGHSMGGMTAAVVASKNPKLLGGLILADPTFLSPKRQREVYESEVAEQHRRILSRPREEYLAEVRARRSNRSPELVEIFAFARMQTSMHAFQVLTPPTPDYQQLIDTIGIPTLLVVGDEGTVVSHEMAHDFASRNPRITVAQIANAGHAVPFDQPERFADVVKTFLHDQHIR